MAGTTEKNSTGNQSDICEVTGYDNDTNNDDNEESNPDYEWSQAARGDLLGSMNTLVEHRCAQRGEPSFLPKS